MLNAVWVLGFHQSAMDGALDVTIVTPSDYAGVEGPPQAVPGGSGGDARDGVGRPTEPCKTGNAVRGSAFCGTGTVDCGAASGFMDR